MKYLKDIVAVSAIFALAAIGVLAIEATRTLQDARNIIDASFAHMQLILTRVDATVTDLDRTVQIAGGAINEARRIERDNREEIAAVNTQSLATLQHVDGLVMSVDASQAQAAHAIADVSTALVPVMAQTERDLRALEPAIQQVTPLLLQSTAVAANLSASTADVEHEIHKLVYPPPRKWYQRYILDPLRTAVHLVTIPIR